jgi:hypothetical protein
MLNIANPIAKIAITIIETFFILFLLPKETLLIISVSK